MRHVADEALRCMREHSHGVVLRLARTYAQAEASGDDQRGIRGTAATPTSTITHAFPDGPGGWTRLRRACADREGIISFEGGGKEGAQWPLMLTLPRSGGGQTRRDTLSIKT